MNHSPLNDQWASPFEPDVSKSVARVMESFTAQLSVRAEDKLLSAMREHGGHFAAALAGAWMLADSDNRVKLRSVFADLLQSYARFLQP